MSCSYIHVLSLVFVLAFTEVANGQTGANNEEWPQLDTALRFVKDSIFINAVQQIKNAAGHNPVEHCIAFGKDSLSKYITSNIAEGNISSSKVPAILNAFADLHNHNNSLPPDAGDLYGLVSICSNNPRYTTRFVITANGILYALIIVNRKAAINFSECYPAQIPVSPGFQPTFPEKIVDEFRELKYRGLQADNQVLNCILKKYNTGVLLKKIY